MKIKLNSTGSLEALIKIIMALFIVRLLFAGVQFIGFGLFSGLILAAFFVTSIFFFRRAIYRLIFGKKPEILERVTIVHIIICAVLVRIIWSIIFHPVPVSDFKLFWNSIQNVLEGNGSVFDTKSPATVLFYAVFLKIYNHLFTAYLVNSVVAGFQIFLIYRITKALSSSTDTSKISAIFYAFYPMGVAFSSVLSSEVVLVTCVLLMTDLAVHKRDVSTVNEIFTRKNLFTLMSIGLLMAFGFLGRTVLAVFAAALLLFWLINIEQRIKLKIVEWVLVGTVCLAALTPQIYYNYKVLNKLSVSPNPYGGYVLLFGTSRESNGAYNEKELEIITEETGITDSESLVELARKKALERIKSNPVDFILFALGDKFVRIWGNDYYFWWTMNDLEISKRGTLFYVLLLTQIYYYSLWLLFLLGLIYNFRKRMGWELYFVFSVLGLAFLHLFFEAQPRYHLPVMPFVCIVAAMAMAQLYHKAKEFRKSDLLQEE